MDSNTFWMISVTSKMFTKSGPFHPIFHAEMLQIIQENYGIITEILFFISQHFGNPIFSDFVTLPDIKDVELMFLLWVLVISWKSENFKNKMFENPEVWKHKQCPTKSKTCLKNIDFWINNFEISIPPNQ